MKIHEILIETVDARDFDPSDWLTNDQLTQLSNQGFDTETILFHGSNSKFEEFNKKFNQTAEHIYLSTDYDTSGLYGQYLYACFGKINPVADLINNYKIINQVATIYNQHYISEQDIKHEFSEEYTELINSIMQELQEENPDMDEYDIESRAEDDPRIEKWVERTGIQSVITQIEHGTMYEVSSRMQDAILGECFSLGYKCVIFHDPSPSGEGISYVFNDSTDIFIIKQVI